MPLGINDEAANFTAESTQACIIFHDGTRWLRDPFLGSKDFTPVCTERSFGYD